MVTLHKCLEELCPNPCSQSNCIHSPWMSIETFFTPNFRIEGSKKFCSLSRLIRWPVCFWRIKGYFCGLSINLWFQRHKIIKLLQLALILLIPWYALPFLFFYPSFGHSGRGQKNSSYSSITTKLLVHLLYIYCIPMVWEDIHLFIVRIW